jgi:hypothetical protein
LELAPRLAAHVTPRYPDWSDIVDAGGNALRHELGVSQALWGEACRIVGRQMAVVILAVVSTKPQEHFTRGAGGYFAAMVKRARTGEPASCISTAVCGSCGATIGAGPRLLKQCGRRCGHGLEPVMRVDLKDEWSACGATFSEKEEAIICAVRLAPYPSSGKVQRSLAAFFRLCAFARGYRKRKGDPERATPDKAAAA